MFESKCSYTNEKKLVLRGIAQARENTTNLLPRTQENTVMSARWETAVKWEAARYKEVCREGWVEVRRRRRRRKAGARRFRLYLGHGGVHHYSQRRFEVEAGWISRGSREAVLIKTVTMQPELP